jgi:hypothetical protein
MAALPELNTLGLNVIRRKKNLSSHVSRWNDRYRASAGASSDAERMICCTLREELLVEVSNLARESRFDYLLVERIPEPLPLAEPRLGRRTVLTFPLPPPPQKN